MDDGTKNNILYFDIAHDLWVDLEARFGQYNKARLLQVEKDVLCLSHGDMDIASYYTKEK